MTDETQDHANAGEQREVELQESLDDLGLGDAPKEPNGAGEKPDTDAADAGEGEDDPGDDNDAGDKDEGASAEGAAPESSASHQDAGKKLPAAVPYNRFKEVNDAKKAAQEAAERAERENAALRAELEASKRAEAVRAARPDNEDELKQAIREAKRKAEDARLDDDADALKAAEEAEIEAHQALAEARAEARRQVRERQAAEDDARKTAEQQAADLTIAANEVVEAYPEIATDEQLQRFVVAERDAQFEAGGVSMADALRNAADAVAKRMGLKGAAASGASTKSPREQASIRKHAAAAAALPARSGPAGEGQRARGPGQDLSADEYYRLPEDEKQALLGIG